MDGLCQYVLEELAMDGEQGTDLSRLSIFIHDYYQQPFVAENVQQVVDERFVTFVWDTIVGLEEVRVFGIPGSNNLDSNGASDPCTSPPAVKSNRRASVDWEELGQEERSLGMQALVQRYGSNLRLAVSPEEAWAAITGSHAKPSCLTASVYQVLQLVSRARTDGITVIEITKFLEIDPRSCFHFVRTAVNLGIVRKFRTNIDGAWTNRLVHTRYLENSPHFAELEQERSPSPIEGESGEAAQHFMRPIGASQLYANIQLVRRRIVRALRECGGTMQHMELGPAVKFVSHCKQDSRRFNSIIRAMIDEGILGQSHSDSWKYDVFLIEQEEKPEEPNLEHEEVEESKEEQNEVDLCRISARLPIERQILDLLLDAGSEGLLNADLSTALGGFQIRFIDQILQRLSKAKAIPHLADQQVVSTFESFGREKRSRWFSHVGYQSRCAREGMDVQDKTDYTYAGGWAVDKENYYSTPSEMMKKLRQTNIGSVPNARSGGPAKRPRKSKAATEDEVLENSNVKPIGRPRKHPKPEGKLTPYERRKLKDAEEGKPSYYERQKAKAKESASNGTPKPTPKKANGATPSTSKSAPKLASKSGSKSTIDLTNEDELEPESQAAETPVQTPKPTRAKPVPNGTASKAASTSKKKTQQSTLDVFMSSPLVAKRPREEVEPTPALLDTPSSAAEPPVKKVRQYLSENADAGQNLNIAPIQSTVEVSAVFEVTTSTPSKPVESTPSKPTIARSKPKSKFNLTSLQRQNELLAFLGANKGVMDLKHLSAEKIKAYMEEIKPQEPAFLMDRHTLKAAISSLLSRDLAKKTSLQVGQGAYITRVDIIHFPSITADSPVMLEYLSELNSTLGPKPKPKAKEAQPVEDGDVVFENRERAREFFKSHVQVAGASNGSLYGRFARAKVLHRYLLGFLDLQGQLAASGERILKSSALSFAMPLGVYLSIVPVGDTSVVFKEFISDENNLLLPLSGIPKWVHAILQPSSSHHRHSIFMTLNYLIYLRLIDALVQTDDGNGNIEYKNTSHKPVGATHWKIHNRAPIYNLSEDGYPLHAILPLTSLEEAEAWWSALYTCSIPGGEKVARNISGDEREFPITFSASTSFRNSLRSYAKWKDTYVLLAPQRKYLTHILQAPLLIEGDTLDEVELLQVSDDILAPINVVREYLENQIMFRQLTETKSKKKEKTEDSSPKRRTADDMAAALQSKAAEASQQREQDWNALFDKFSKENESFKPHDLVKTYLQKRFLSRSSRIEAKELEQEFYLLVPRQNRGLVEDKMDKSYKTIVPRNILVAAGVIERDPHALPSQPQIKRRVKAIHRPVNVRKSVPEPIVLTGDQDQFLSIAPKQVPTLAKGERLPRGFFTEEQDDLLVDAVSVIMERRDRLNARLSFTPLSSLFSGMPSSKLRTHYNRLVERRGLKFYVYHLQAAWRRVWLEKEGTGELPDPHPDSVNVFDIAAYIRCLRANIDKQALHLVGPPEDAPPITGIPKLPNSLSSIFDLHHIVPVGGSFHYSSRWSDYWKPITVQTRQSIIAELPFGSSCWDLVENSADNVEDTEAQVKQRATDIASAALKMLLVTPEESYEENDGVSFIQPYQDILEHGLVSELVEKNILVRLHSENTRRSPGRNFMLSEKFEGLFEEGFGLAKGQDANALHQKLHQSGDTVWPIISTDGDMMALIDMVSRAKITMTIDLSPSAHLRDPYDYQTRKADDEWLENAVHVSLKEDIIADYACPVPSTIQFTQNNTKEDRLDLSTYALSLGFTDNPIVSVLAHVGTQGVSLNSLKTIGLGFGFNYADTEVCVSHLMDCSPPAVFYAGMTSPRLIPCTWIPEWTVKTIVKSVEKPQEDSMDVDLRTVAVIPSVWLDIHGHHVDKMWKRACWWIKSTLFRYPGSTTERICQRARSNGILSVCEVLMLLKGLQDCSRVRSANIDFTTRAVQWENARWFLSNDHEWYEL